MGLDMYLHREVSVPAYDIDDGPDGYFAKGRARAQRIADAIEEPLVAVGSSYEVHIPVAYWRKANAIHAYIVDTHGGGVDECQNIDLEAADLRELVRLCKEVLADPAKAPDLLPTQSGFFFGSTDYGEDYLHDLRETVSMLEAGLAIAGEHPYFVYRASW